MVVGTMAVSPQYTGAVRLARFQRADPGVVRRHLRGAHAAQAQAWSAIADGDNTLVIAPTGSGKTLAAFLWAIDRLAGASLRTPRRAPGSSTCRR